MERGLCTDAFTLTLTLTLTATARETVCVGVNGGLLDLDYTGTLDISVICSSGPWRWTQRKRHLRSPHRCWMRGHEQIVLGERWLLFVAHVLACRPGSF